MSLVIYVSHKTVIISKYQLEFPFTPPPDNLSKAALEAYRLLRQSEILQIESTRDQREEVITLLRHYGQALYEAIIPLHVKSQVYKAGGIFIYALEKEIINLPWELLYDGSSFFGLTQGVVRINNSKIDPPATITKGLQDSLKVSLNAFAPYQIDSLGNRFISYVEELTSENFNKSPLLEIQVNGNAERDSILKSLNFHPDIFMFSGFDTKENWILKDNTDENLDGQWYREYLKPGLIEAVKHGLRIVILNTSTLLKDSNPFGADPLARYFDMGVPYIISIHGRLARERWKEYFQMFLLALLREENILRAHRQAINSIQSNLPLSWDWSWIRLHINKNLLETPADMPLPPFRFRRKTNKIKAKTAFNHNILFNRRRFIGNYKILDKITQALLDLPEDQIVSIKGTNGQMVEEYLQEFFRRLTPHRPFSISVLYYQRWGFLKGQREKLSSSKYTKLFSFLLENKNIINHFESNIISIKNGELNDLKFLLVNTPPTRFDHAFDTWLKKKQEDGWRIIILDGDETSTSLDGITISTDAVELYQLINAFEDELPEQWQESLSDQLPIQMNNMTLLKIAQQLADRQLIELFIKKTSRQKLWEVTYDTVLSTLSSQKMKILFTLYLLRVKCSKKYLAKLLIIKNIDSDLWYLHRLFLIETDLDATGFWIPIHIHQQIDRYHLFPEKHLRNIGQELLQRQIGIISNGSGSLKKRYINGFQYCIGELTKLGVVENPLQRNLQFGKKLARLLPNNKYFFQANISISLELALLIQKGKLIQKTLFSIVGIMENYPLLQKETIHLCEWLLKIEEKHRNWTLVSEIQMKIASIHAKSNKKEKAIGLISSAIQLNNDIKNYSSRYQNLIAIALLLLDLDEYEKLGKLMGNADFDLNLLNKEDIAKLWLIDGHMLCFNRRYKEAEKSFAKTSLNSGLSIPDNLKAKTHISLAEIFRDRKDQNQYMLNLDKASEFFELSGDIIKACQIHEELYESYVSSSDIKKAIVHLEWLFDYYKKSGRNNRLRNIADQLGGLYFKIGDQTKSTDYYSIAQGI